MVEIPDVMDSHLYTAGAWLLATIGSSLIARADSAVMPPIGLEPMTRAPGNSEDWEVFNDGSFRPALPERVRAGLSGYLKTHERSRSR